MCYGPFIMSQIPIPILCQIPQGTVRWATTRATLTACPAPPSTSACTPSTRRAPSTTQRWEAEWKCRPSENAGKVKQCVSGVSTGQGGEGAAGQDKSKEGWGEGGEENIQHRRCVTNQKTTKHSLIDINLDDFWFGFSQWKKDGKQDLEKNALLSKTSIRKSNKGARWL